MRAHSLHSEPFLINLKEDLPHESLIAAGRRHRHGGAYPNPKSHKAQKSCGIRASEPSEQKNFTRIVSDSE